MKAAQRGRDRTEGPPNRGARHQRGPPSEHTLFGLLFRPESPHTHTHSHSVTHTHTHSSLLVGFLKAWLWGRGYVLAPSFNWPSTSPLLLKERRRRRKVSGCSGATIMSASVSQKTYLPSNPPAGSLPAGNGALSLAHSLSLIVGWLWIQGWLLLTG